MAKGYVWKKGEASVKGVLEFTGKIARVVRKHSAKGQWGEGKDGGATVLEFKVDTTNVSDEALREGYVEWWLINRFRRHSGILDTLPNDAIATWDGKTFDPTVDCLPPEGREKVPDDVKVVRIVERMSAEERKELLKQLREMK